MSLQPDTLGGQPALAWQAPTGDRLRVALHGGQLLSWCSPDGVERLYLSPRARFDGDSAIRGGVPICFPQFNQRGPLVKHGFARNLPWRLDEAASSADTLVLALDDSPASRALWPERFAARLRLSLPAPGRLHLALALRNTGTTPWAFTAALHTYLRVDDLDACTLQGLQGAACWDAVRDLRGTESEAALRFGDEFDRVYATPAAPLMLRQPGGTLRITAGAHCPQTVVWNPGPALCAQLADMPPEGWRHMLCVEAASIDAPVSLGPGASQVLEQTLDLLPAPPSA